MTYRSFTVKLPKMFCQSVGDDQQFDLLHEIVIYHQE